MVSPTVKIQIGEQVLETLIDSGSDVCAVSDKFYKGIKNEELDIPILPVTNVSIAVAVGGITQRIKNQVMLPFTVAGCRMDVICLVVPHLNCEILLGSN